MPNGNNNGHHRNGTGNGLVHLNGNGHKPDVATATEHDPALDAGHDLLWDGLSPTVTKALGQPLDPALVSTRRGTAGRTFSYIEGHVAIDEANAIFGYGGWGYELAGEVTLREVANVDPKTGEIKTSSAYSAPVRVTVPGAPPRTDVGFHAVADETPDGHDTAIKGAVTDGMKRALRSFGDRFGNGLYGDRAPASSPPRPERVPAKAQVDRPVRQAQGRRNESQLEKLRKRLIEIATEQGFDEDGVRTAVLNRTGKSVDDLTVDELGPLVEAASNKLNQMRQARAA